MAAAENDRSAEPLPQGTPPSGNPEESKVHHLHVRVPSDHKGRWVAASRSGGIKLSDWVTKTLDNAATREELSSLVRCEVCRKKRPTSFSATEHPLSGWKFTCQCTEDTELYWVLIRDFTENPTKWIHHLFEKHGMDFYSFSRAVVRYQAAIFAAKDNRVEKPPE